MRNRADRVAAAKLHGSGVKPVPDGMEYRLAHGIVDARHAVLHAWPVVAHKHVIRRVLAFRLPYPAVVETPQVVIRRPVTRRFLAMVCKKIHGHAGVDNPLRSAPRDGTGLHHTVPSCASARDRSVWGDFGFHKEVAAVWNVGVTVLLEFRSVLEPDGLPPETQQVKTLFRRVFTERTEQARISAAVGVAEPDLRLGSALASDARINVKRTVRLYPLDEVVGRILRRRRTIRRRGHHRKRKSNHAKCNYHILHRFLLVCHSVTIGSFPVSTTPQDTFPTGRKIL